MCVRACVRARVCVCVLGGPALTDILPRGPVPDRPTGGRYEALPELPAADLQAEGLHAHGMQAEGGRLRPLLLLAVPRGACRS